MYVFGSNISSFINNEKVRHKTLNGDFVWKQYINLRKDESEMQIKLADKE